MGEKERAPSPIHSIAGVGACAQAKFGGSRGFRAAESYLSRAAAQRLLTNDMPTFSQRPEGPPLVGVIMGSRNDLRVMSSAVTTLEALGVPHEVQVVSAHRTPDRMFEYARAAESRGLEVIIAAAGGAAHLPGMVAACTILPVLGVPIPATQLNGVDALLSIVQMPKGIPVGTLAIGEPGAMNAALLATAILAGSRPELRERLRAWRAARTADVLADTDLSAPAS
jgi:5-(carboxyamino)imidazole ribonucleotide mutase